MAKVQWLSQREMAMWIGFVQMRQVLDQAIDRQLGEHGLSSADFEVLAPLSEAPDAIMRPRDLGRANGWDRSRLAHQLRRMEQRGLVRRFDCMTDGRGTLVQLTDQGQVALTAAAPGHVDTLRRVLVDLLTDDEVDVLTSVARRVVGQRVDPCPASRPYGDAEIP